MARFKSGIIFCLTLFAIFIVAGRAVAITDQDQDGPSTPSQEDNRTFSKSFLSGDSLDIPKNEVEQPAFRNVEKEASTLNESKPDFNRESDFYDDEDENSESFISFNFLYYLIEKFKFTNALEY